MSPSPTGGARNKAFCVLDQGSVADDPLSREKKRLFTSAVSDYYRLNWRTGEDPCADFSFSGPSLFSEGRCALLELVPRRYQWYIFVDDDVVFHDGLVEHERSRSCPDIPHRIASFLARYRPLTGTFHNPGDWTQAHLDLDRLAREVAVPIKAYDITACLYHASALPHLFPVPYHGTFGIFWFQQYVVHETHPGKQVCFGGVSVRNTAHRGHRADAMARKHEAMDLFNAATRQGNFDHRAEWSNASVQAANRELSRTGRADPWPVSLRQQTVASVYDIGTEAYRNRTALAPQGNPGAPGLRCITAAFDGAPDTTLLMCRIVGIYGVGLAAEAGTDSGMTTQYLARLCERVRTADCDGVRLRAAQERLSAFFDNIDFANPSPTDMMSLQWLGDDLRLASPDGERLLVYLNARRIGVECAYAMAARIAGQDGLRDRALIVLSGVGGDADAPGAVPAGSHARVEWRSPPGTDLAACPAMTLLVPCAWGRLDEWTQPSVAGATGMLFRIAMPR